METACDSFLAPERPLPNSEGKSGFFGKDGDGGADSCLNRAMGT